MLSTMLKQQEQQQQQMMMMIFFNQQQQQLHRLYFPCWKKLFQNKTQLFLLFALWIHRRSVLSELSICSTCYQLKYCVSTVFKIVIFTYLLCFLHWQPTRTRKPISCVLLSASFGGHFRVLRSLSFLVRPNCKVFYHM